MTGLSAGLVLKTLPNVRSVTILEKATEGKLHDQGAGIRVGPEVQEFFRKYVGKPAETYAVPLPRLIILDKDGNKVTERPSAGSFATSWGQLFRVLNEAFLDQQSQCMCLYRNTCEATEFIDDGKRVDISFRNESGTEGTIAADLVLGADGASSIVRQTFLPDTRRTPVGYVIQRGLVPVRELSEATREVLEGAGTFHFNLNSQILSYNVPGSGESLEAAEILCNWGWYQAYEPELMEDLMTDTEGFTHKFTLPIGKMQPKWIERMRDAAKREVPAQFSELVHKTENPFVQVITDSLASQNAFWEGKVLLLGDSAAGQR